MNYYKRHLGDFARDTAHLSQGQIGAYDLLMDWYYANERPLPTDMDDVCRIARAFTRDERQNVSKVLAAFFVESPEGFRQKRVEQELSDMRERRETNRKVAVEREENKRSTNRATNRRTNGAHPQ